jgi:hypothetical protein
MRPFYPQEYPIFSRLEPLDRRNEKPEKDIGWIPGNGNGFRSVGKMDPEKGRLGKKFIEGYIRIIRFPHSFGNRWSGDPASNFLL